MDRSLTELVDKKKSAELVRQLQLFRPVFGSALVSSLVRSSVCSGSRELCRRPRYMNPIRGGVGWPESFFCARAIENTLDI